MAVVQLEGGQSVPARAQMCPWMRSSVPQVTAWPRMGTGINQDSPLLQKRLSHADGKYLYQEKRPAVGWS